MTIIIECPRCGYERTATEAEVRAGAWRTCPVCTVDATRASREENLTATPDHDVIAEDRDEATRI